MARNKSQELKIFAYLILFFTFCLDVNILIDDKYLISAYKNLHRAFNDFCLKGFLITFCFTNEPVSSRDQLFVWTIKIHEFTLRFLPFIPSLTSLTVHFYD